MDLLESDRDFDDVVQMTGGCMIHARREETLEKGLATYERLSTMMKISPYERKEKGLTVETFMNVPRYRYFLLWALMPAVDRASDLGFRGQALHEAVITVLTLKRWQKERGMYPQTLTALVQAGYLETIPDDPYSAGPLRYELRGDYFVLYSLGKDFDDDGGVPAADSRYQYPWGTHADAGGDRVFWPVENQEQRRGDQ